MTQALECSLSLFNKYWWNIYHIVKYKCESWTIKNAECWRIDAFKLWCWRRLLRTPCAAGRSNQSILKGINPEYSFIERTDAEVLILWPPDAKSQLTGKDTDAGKDWRQEEKGMTEDEMVGWHHWLNGHEYDMSGRQWRTEKPGLLQSIVLQRDKTERLNNNNNKMSWTDFLKKDVGHCKLYVYLEHHKAKKEWVTKLLYYAY